MKLEPQHEVGEHLDTEELRRIRKARGDDYEDDILNTVIEVRPILHGNQTTGYVYCCGEDIEDKYTTTELQEGGYYE